MTTGIVHSYQEQFDRARRYYQRFKNLNDGIVHNTSSENYVDDVHAFFQNCYHLKEWLKNDPSFTRYSNKEIEDYVTKTPALAICADICNGLKHLQLKSPPRSGAVPSFGPKLVRVQLEDSISGEELPTRIEIHFEIEHSGQRLDAFQVATEAITAWEKFLA